MKNGIRRLKSLPSRILRKWNGLTEKIVTLRWSRHWKRAMSKERAQGKKIVGINLATPGFVQFVLPIYRELIARTDRLAFYLAVEYPIRGVHEPFELEPWRCIPARVASGMKTLDLWIKTAMITTPGPVTALKIYTGHGFGAKFNNWQPQYYRNLDVFFLNGPIQRKMMEEFMAEHPDYTSHIQLRDIGHPKNDELFGGKYQREEVLRRINLDPALRTVIYAPAWDSGGALRVHGEKVIDVLLAMDDLNVIVKLHQTSLEPRNSPYYEGFTGGVDWLRRFSGYESHARFRLIREHNINRYLVASDVMITDFSGVAWTFMLLDRPVIYIDCPEYFEKTLPSQGQDPRISKTDEALNAGRHVGRLVSCPEEIPNALIELLTNTDFKAEERRLLVSRLLYNPGRGTVAAAEEILRLAGLTDQG